MRITGEGDGKWGRKVNGGGKDNGCKEKENEW